MTDRTRSKNFPVISTDSNADAVWQKQVTDSIVDVDRLAEVLPVDRQAVAETAAVYPLRITPYFLSLIRQAGDPLWRQVIPDRAELADRTGLADPLADRRHSPVPGLVHRYPDRVLWLVAGRCATYCRFCFRKARLGRAGDLSDARIDQGLAYIRRNPAIWEVILSGGDPLMLSDQRLEAILTGLGAIGHVAVRRIHTRMPITLPQRITPALTAILARHQPLYLMIHCNHPAELTAQSTAVIGKLADAGVPLASQSVVLNGLNDDPATLAALFKTLVAHRVRPYDLHLADPTAGTAHWRTNPQAAIALAKALRGHLSGLCQPHLLMELPEGAGKVPLAPRYVRRKGSAAWQVETFRGQRVDVPIHRRR